MIMIRRVIVVIIMIVIKILITTLTVIMIMIIIVIHTNSVQPDQRNKSISTMETFASNRCSCLDEFDPYVYLK